MTEELEPYLDLIEHAALDPERWGPALERIGDRIGASGGAFLVSGPNGWEGHKFAGEGAARADLYLQSEAATRSQCPSRLIALNANAFVPESAAFARAEWAAEPLVVDWAAPSGLHHVAATAVPIGHESAAIIHWQRRTGRDPFGPVEFAWLNALRPHLGMAARHAARSRMTGMLNAEDLLKATGAAAAIVDRRGRVLKANAGFQDLAGIVYRSIDPIVFADPRADQALRYTLKTGSSAEIVAVSESGTVADIRIEALQGIFRDLVEGGTMLVAVSLVTTPGLPDVARVQEAFGLTPAQAAVAVATGAGMTAGEIAASLGIGLPTVRKHQSVVRQKLGVSRSVDIARVIAGLTAKPHAH